MGDKVPNKSAKRKLVLDDEDDDNRVYRFKVLLPNGLMVGVRLDNPAPQLPLQDFVKLVEKHYVMMRRQSRVVPTRNVNWKSESLYFEDSQDRKIIQRIKFMNYKPNKCHILRLYDGNSRISETYENMWDLTPDTDLLKELPDAYDFESALADLIDNSLQAVWSNGENDRRLIRVDIIEDKVSIFDTGLGMDSSEENSIVKWGKMGASIHRSLKANAIGGRPPYLMPYFGMFGYGGPIASMQMGRQALVSSKTKQSSKVYTLHLQREALLKKSDSEQSWKTRGGLRNPSEDEVRESPHGSFTKVEISELKLKRLKVFQLQCKLKDIYFPYVQCDEMSGKTTRPIEFLVNGIDLAEVTSGEVTVTNWYSCNGPEFVFQLKFAYDQEHSPIKSTGFTRREANARLKCVYFPFLEGKENIERILEKLEEEGCGIRENFNTFSRVSVRRLGRLLPDARWGFLPFMEYVQKRGDKARLVKKCCSRVKCFIETDAGFNPTPSKTDLAQHCVFTAALRNLGGKADDKRQDVDIEISINGKLCTISQLEKQYHEWILQMHERYDKEMESGEDDPVMVVSPPNKKQLGISSDVFRVHTVLHRKGASWRKGQNIKILKGAAAGFHKNNVYATIEYFLIEGMHGDAGGPLDVGEEKGCRLAVNNGDASLEIENSLSAPINIIDSGKCLTVGSTEWESQLEKKRLKAPSSISLLCLDQCRELEINEALPVNGIVHAGQVPPRELVAVARPASYNSKSTSETLDQKYIAQTSAQMSMVVQFSNKGKSHENAHLYSALVSPTSRNGFNGLYVFAPTDKLQDLFKKAGMYTFLFSLTDLNCKSYEKKVTVRASPESEVRNWKLLTGGQEQSYSVSIGTSFPNIEIGCFDVYENQIPFTSVPKLTIRLSAQEKEDGFGYVKNSMVDLSPNKSVLRVRRFVVDNIHVDRIRPTYRATLHIAAENEDLSISIPCTVTPGPLKHVKASIPLSEGLCPGSVLKDFSLEMLDAYGNHVIEGTEVKLSVDGFEILDRCGPKRTVDANGFVNLCGALKVKAGFGETASVYVSSDSKVIFEKEFQIDTRMLEIASEVPSSCYAGSRLENLVFRVVNSEGHIEKTIHDDLESGQAHTLTIRYPSNTDGSIRYAFSYGCCTVPSIQIPNVEGSLCLTASHSFYSQLHCDVLVDVIKAPEAECRMIQSPSSNGKCLSFEDYSPCTDVQTLALSNPKDECKTIQSPSSNGKCLSLEDHTPCTNVGQLALSNPKTVQKLGDDVLKLAKLVGDFERELNEKHKQKEEIVQDMSQLQDSAKDHSHSIMDCLLTKENVEERIERSELASVIVGNQSRDQLSPRNEPISRGVVIGLVVQLGTVRTSKLSRILAEFLGEDQMLAVVCRSFREAVTALEKYKENGDIDYESGIYAQATALGRSINGRFNIICIEDLWPQVNLKLDPPTMPNGETRPGFLGYAVNMVDIDRNHMGTRTAGGHGLRETLFYHLFGKLQVYETRELMYNARDRCHISKDGAVSLDGGILRANGVASLGHREPWICFPVVASGGEMCSTIVKRVDGLNAKLEENAREIEALAEGHGKVVKKFQRKKEKMRRLVNSEE
ncbi:Structural maintenance of chromosomes flexible hinge domain-containing protein GMI1 [Linum perenne]